MRSSTVDIVLSRVKIPCLNRLEGHIAEKSDHYPIVLEAEASIDTGAGRPRRISKTMLQSPLLKETIGTAYKVALKPAMESLIKHDTE